MKYVSQKRVTGRIIEESTESTLPFYVRLVVRFHVLPMGGGVPQRCVAGQTQTQGPLEPLHLYPLYPCSPASFTLPFLPRHDMTNRGHRPTVSVPRSSQRTPGLAPFNNCMPGRRVGKTRDRLVERR
jgi:hypothetical protein